MKVPEENSFGVKIKNKYFSNCFRCGKALLPGREVWYIAKLKKVNCLKCTPSAVDEVLEQLNRRGNAKQSEYSRDASRYYQ